MSARKPMLSAADDADLFPDGWLTTHLDALMDELAARPPEFWPRLVGSRAEAQACIDAELHRLRDAKRALTLLEEIAQRGGTVGEWRRAVEDGRGARMNPAATQTKNVPATGKGDGEQSDYEESNHE